MRFAKFQQITTHRLFVNHDKVNLFFAHARSSSQIVPQLLALDPPPPQHQLLHRKLGAGSTNMFSFSLVNVSDVAH
jgi:hypothetical protein